MLRSSLVVAVLAVALTLEAASLVLTTSAPNAMPSASKYVTHWASGHYWIAVRDGSQSKLVLFSSPDGVTWTEQGAIFDTFYPADFEWAVRYSGDTLVAFGYRSSDDLRYYRKGTLGSAGGVTWNSPEVATSPVADVADQQINAAIINGKPVMWRAGPNNTDDGVLTVGDQLDAPVTWTEYPAPSLSAVTSGGFSAGAIVALGGSDPDDLIILRSTTKDVYLAGSHRLVAVKFDASAGAFDPSWYNVSTLGGGLAEDTTTEVRVMVDGSAHMRFVAVQDANGSIHAIYVNRNSQAVHYRKEPGLNDNWVRLSTDITGASTTSKAGLSAVDNGNLLLYYEKGDQKIWTRRFDGSVWEPESLLFDSGGTDINDSLGPMEVVAECASGLTFSEGLSSPVNILFELGGATCDVQAFTATSTSDQNRLQWVNPTGPYDHTRILARDDGVFPTDPNDLVNARLVRDDFGTAGAKATWDDTFPSNGETHHYTAFAHDGTSYAVGVPVTGRPFDNSGSVKWAFNTRATSMAPPGVRFRGTAPFVYVVSDNLVHAVDGSATGGDWPPSWKPLAIGGAAQSRLPVLPFPVGSAANGIALAGSQDGHVYAVDAESGALEWQSSTLGGMVQGSPGGIFSAYGAPFDLVVAGTRNTTPPNFFHALQLFANGALAWTFDNSPAQGGDGTTIGMISGAPALSYADVGPGQRLLYFTSHAGGSPNTVWCLKYDASTVALEWGSDLPPASKGSDVETGPVLYNNRIYVGTVGGEVVALDNTGAVQWVYDANDGPIKSFVFPRFGTPQVFFSTNNNVTLLRDDGAGYTVMPGWPVSSIPSPSTPLFVIGTNEVVVGGGDGFLYRMDADSPSPVGIKLGDGLSALGPPSLNGLDAMIYVGTDAGTIYAVKFPF